MKWFMVIWLLTAGIGFSFSVVTERKKELQFLKEMEHSLARLAYYMYQWRMPVEEAVAHTCEEEKGVLLDFYKSIIFYLKERQTEDLGQLWQEKSKELFQKIKLSEEIKKLWQECFFHIPTEPEALHKRLSLRIEEIEAHRISMQEKYKSEQRLVLTMGFFTSAFLCLILW